MFHFRDMAEKISPVQSVSGSAAAFEWRRSSKPIDGWKRNRAGEKIVVLTCELNDVEDSRAVMSQHVADCIWQVSRILDPNRMDAHGAGHSCEVRILQIGSCFDETRHLHLQRHEAQDAVVEDHDFYRQIHLGQGDEVAHQHGKSAVTRHGYDLAPRLGGLDSDRVRHGIGHRAVGPGPDETPAAIHHEVAGRPDGGRADIGREDARARRPNRP